MASKLTVAQLEAKIVRVRARWRYAQARANSAKSIATKTKYTKLAAARLNLLKELKKDLKVLKEHGKNPSKTYHISSKGLDLIKSFEGFVPTIQDDGFGNPTVGYGHVVSYRSDPASVKAAKKAVFEKKYGKTLTKADATELLKHDLIKYEEYVKQYIRIGITQNMFDALTSIVYNTGPASVNGSTIQRELNKGHYHNAANAFLLWDKANGGVVEGLKRRREAERKLFLEGI